MNSQISEFEGETRIEKIKFKKSEDRNPEKELSSEGITEYFVKPDLIIVENGVGKPKVDISTIIEQK